MEKVLRIILPIVILVLSYLVYDSIATPMREQKKIAALEAKIIERLNHIKTAQFAYRELTNTFAPNFDTLIYVLRNGQMPRIKVEGDPEDTTSQLTYDTSYVSLYAYAFENVQVNLDSLAYVPLNPNGAKFKMEAGFVDINNTKVPVFQVEDPEPYNKQRALTLGSMVEPVYNGNWE